MTQIGLSVSGMKIQLTSLQICPWRIASRSSISAEIYFGSRLTRMKTSALRATT
jgi:hypothetical protein